MFRSTFFFTPHVAQLVRLYGFGLKKHSDGDARFPLKDNRIVPRGVQPK